ncbi:hypothetical protein LY78DRAFT_695641 [Colletotrichum sublineola]|nr:hypothetical protein LY78DRAFT_695641 [Colletotrichum sublineola]
MIPYSVLTLFSLCLIASVSGGYVSRRGDDWRPALHEVQGCHTHVAVNADGFHSGGLNPTVEDGSDCQHSSKNQVSSRAIKAAPAIADPEPIIDGPRIDLKHPPPDPVFQPTPPRSKTAPKLAQSPTPALNRPVQPQPAVQPSQPGPGRYRPQRPNFPQFRRPFIRDIEGDEKPALDGPEVDLTNPPADPRPLF